MLITTYDINAPLLRRLANGDMEAFIKVYDRYHSPLYYYVLRFVKVPAIAEDVLQDVFMKIWETRERINPELSFQAYLYRISRNAVLKLMKKIGDDESLRLRVMKQLQQSVSVTELQVLWREYEQLLNSAIAALPPQRQKVFLLCRQEEKTYDEVASELGISRNTVKEHMVLAMQAIKLHFKDHGDLSLGMVYLLFFYC